MLTRFTNDQSVIAYFTEGQCNALAYELHKLTGWSLAIISDAPVGQRDYGGHAFVFDSDAQVIDIRGRQPLDVFWKDWTFLPLIHRFHTRKEYEYEMQLWENNIPYTRDREAKQWARLIVDMLDS
jgi:hypothetical protein